MNFFRKGLGILCTIITTMNSVHALNPSQPQPEKINIGIYAPFSSDSAYIGRNMLGAMEIARAQMPSAKVRYTFYTLDSATSSKSAAEVLQKFVMAHKINILMSEGDQNAVLVANVAKKNKLLHFCLGCAPQAVDGNSFSTQTSSLPRGTVLKEARHAQFISQYNQEYMSHPVAEGAYAYDLFRIINHSVLSVLKKPSEYQIKNVSEHLLSCKTLPSGLMGPVHFHNKVSLTHIG